MQKIPIQGNITGGERNGSRETDEKIWEKICI